MPVLGITGTGGSGKSSLTDELLRRFRLDQEDKLRIAVLAVDPTRRRGGGALLGDRIRMNAIDPPQVLFRSLATRGSSEVPEALDDIITACRAAGYDLVIVETPGIGQGDAGIVDHVDVPIYVMTPEFGAASQLEKIDMLDFAEVVAINKFERRGAEDALRDVRRQMARNRERFDVDPGGPAGVRHDRGAVQRRRRHRALPAPPRRSCRSGACPSARGRCAPVAGTREHEDRLDRAARAQPLPRRRRRHRPRLPRRHRRAGAAQCARSATCWGPRTWSPARAAARASIDAALESSMAAVDESSRALLDGWPAQVDELSGPTHASGAPLVRESPSGTLVPRVALPRYDDPGQLLRFLRAEHLPGHFPFTAGVFPLKRDGEDPARMFAGEGDAFRTNRRFHLLAEGQPATRLSTAFDSVTLYGFDPDERPDIYGKVGNAGVSIATLDDMEVLYDGFDLCDPSTSVSMTINGPAPTILAMFLNTAIDQHPELEPAEVLRRVRGTVQADILKEDQGQNTCIFSTEFSLGLMADIQEWFVEHEVRSFYSVSISGYHIAEAGANPLSQLAFTLANGFTYVESYLARGLDIDDFAPNLSFFFSNGMDPEYAVLGRVARRIWAIAMRDRYGADERSQKLKYHVQTSGRSLHAQEMDFNDIRTTLQALIALYDNANSLHTNAYDEAVTTPTAESVRRALAIQMIINREWGLSMNENPNQGSFIIEQLTDLVEEAVLAELERISERGGVLGAMETGYQRGRIQDESMRYEHAQARRHPADHRRQHVPGARRPGRRAAGDRAGPLHRRGEAEPAHPPRGLPRRPRRRVPRHARPPPRRRPRRRQPVRRAHGRRARSAASARSPTPSSRSAAATAATSDQRLWSTSAWRTSAST